MSARSHHTVILMDGYDDGMDKDPKELYLTDLVSGKDASSSSDSGISTLDDFQDIANVTDLHSFLDGELKDLDFGLDFSLTKLEQDDVFDSELLVKREPKSPSPTLSIQSGSDGYCPQQPLSPDFFNYQNDISIKDERTHMILPTCYTHHSYDTEEHYAPSPSSFPQETYIIEAACSPSPSMSPSSPSSPYQSPSSPPLFPTYLPNVKKETSSPSAGHMQPPVSPPAAQQRYIVMPSLAPVKRDSTPGVTIITSQPNIVIQQGNEAKLTTAFNIDTILNSKIKIQPKPGSESISPPAGLQWITTTSSQVPYTTQSIPIISSSSIVSGVVPAIADEKSLKRAQRIIKNRESASLSRKRKKEYLSSLEERLQQCKDENDRLLKENDTLRRQVEVLQKENVTLKHPSGISPAKKLCLLCFGLLLTLNLSQISFMNNINTLNSQPGLGGGQVRTGRHLLSVADDINVQKLTYGGGRNDNWPPTLLMRLDEELILLAEKLNITERLGNMCPMYFNSTESVRLAEQLRGWMISQEEEKKKNKEKKRQKKKKDYPPIKKFGTDSFKSYTQAVRNSEVNGPSVKGNNYPIQIFSGAYDSRQQLLNAIPRRNDTFYVLSFSTDYFLVPATAHNKTMRPRMSLLMPVVNPSINESTGQTQNSIGMMQIDCEILNTNLIQVQRSAFPEDNLFNSTAYDSNHKQNSTNNNHENNIHGQKQEKQNKYWDRLRNSNKR
ncbi:cyclic AMP-dependent transcription factor ATF-6 alpha-like isoform X2 [Physella acuta]|uniref:cyclic AMP-dependent transcription factor ATF-6 alpha-like isoform X2 n=1 Tax=Physella acuta TaxID=109671 RepID=UPI0027DC06B3|nr:cyclic AMP-dependent transcription factor ATF-6 alpha-like isoform X2 [Physella acuta]